MQTPDGLQVDDHEIYSFDCIVGGVHMESNRNVWRSVKYTPIFMLNILYKQDIPPMVEDWAGSDIGIVVHLLQVQWGVQVYSQFIRTE